jgi:hypothetical protein
MPAYWKIFDRAIVIPRRNISPQDLKSSIGTYESLLDLYTLLSFVLIIASIIRVERLAGYDPNSMLVTTQLVSPEARTPHLVPRDEMVLLIFRTNRVFMTSSRITTNYVDCLGVIDGPTQSATNLSVTLDGLDGTLRPFSQEFGRVKRIKLGAYDMKETSDALMVLRIAEWLNTNGFNKTGLFFAGHNE